MPAATTPRKRLHLDPAQTTLTTFFHPASTPNPLHPLTTTTPTPTPLAPKLPPQIQSALLNVGMRVRKAVPEGYKSGTYAKVKGVQREKRVREEEVVVEGEVEDGEVTMRDVARGVRGWVDETEEEEEGGEGMSVDEVDGFEEAGFLRPVEEVV